MLLVKPMTRLLEVLGLSYPGGPVIDKLAEVGEDTYDLAIAYG